jgi:hypothetical protein
MRTGVSPCCAGANGSEPLCVSTFVTSVALLKWARESGCPWSEQTCAAAAWEGMVAHGIRPTRLDVSIPATS